MGNCFGEEKGGGNSGNSGGGKVEEKPKQGTKILLLGAGESGKSTIHKQVKILHSKGFSGRELGHYKSTVYSNMIETIARLYKACQEHKVALENDENDKMAKRILEISKDTSLHTTAIKIYTDEIHKIIDILWKDKSMQQAFSTRRNKYHIFDGVEFFMKDMDRLKPETFEPTPDDIVYCRSKTTGIVEINFTLNDALFTLLDVGGQRNERKKWIHFFDGVDAIIFVVSLSEYDQTCYEDDITNRIKESLDLFDETANKDIFKKTHIFLFFNKIDLFRKKIQGIDLKVAFEDYDGGCDFEKAQNFIEQKFRERNNYDKDRITVFFTNATKKKDIDDTLKQLASVMLSDKFKKKN